MASMTGTQKLFNAINKIPPSVQDAVSGALEVNGKELVSEIRKNVPVDEADLRNSVKYKMGGFRLQGLDKGFASKMHNQKLTLGVKAGDRKNAPYARFVEFGTVKMAARPYFWPTYRALRKRLKARVSRAVGKAVKNAFTGVLSPEAARIVLNRK